MTLKEILGFHAAEDRLFPEGGDTEEELNLIQRLIDENPGRRFTVKELADTLGLKFSRVQFLVRQGNADGNLDLEIKSLDLNIGQRSTNIVRWVKSKITPKIDTNQTIRRLPNGGLSSDLNDTDLLGLEARAEFYLTTRRKPYKPGKSVFRKF